MSRALLAASVGALAVAVILFERRRRRRAQVPSLPPCIVISLERLQVARKRALQRAAEAGLPDVEVFNAVNGRELDHEGLTRRGITLYAGWRLENTGFRFFDRELKWGEVGCALSHLGVWSRVLALSHPVALVIEDDVDFIDGFADKLRATLAEVTALVAGGAIAEPDAMYLARKAMRPEHDKLLPRATECGGGHGGATRDRPCPVRLLVPGFSYKTTAYLLWSSGARKLLASGFSGKLIPVDDFLALTYAPHEAKAGLPRHDLDELFANAPRLHMLAVRPQLCRERRGVSSTENSKLISE